jgi:hypothetical protein
LIKDIIILKSRSAQYRETRTGKQEDEMHRFKRGAWFLLIVTMILSSGMMAGCTKKPGGGAGTAGSGASKLDEARTAAISAEQKLGELRQERIKLEKELQAKQAEPQK